MSEQQQPPQEFADAVHEPGTWIPQVVAHGAFEVWQFHRHGSKGGAPTQMFIRPAEGGDPAAIGRGITTTVLREINPSHVLSDDEVMSTLVGLAKEVAQDPLEKRLAALLHKAAKPTDEYLAALSLQYERLTESGVRSPVPILMRITGKGQGTVKSHLILARKKGFLESVGTKAGGQATDKAHVLLGTATPIE
ncbi:hypothetical protein [Streptomyces formicae]